MGPTANLAILLAVVALPREARPDAAPVSSPLDAAFSADGKRLFVTDATGGALRVIDAGTRIVTGSVALRGRPAGVAVHPDGKHVFVAEQGASSVAEIDAVGLTVTRRFPVGRYPAGVALAPRRRLLLVAGTTENDVTILDLDSGMPRQRVAVGREPSHVAVSPDESVAVTGNLLPAGAATTSIRAASIGVIDLESLRAGAELALPQGSVAARGVAFSPDGRWIYAAHTISHPQSFDGDARWIADGAVSIIDVAARRVYASLLVTTFLTGAPDPWGLAVSDGGRSLWLTVSGGRALARLDLEKLHRYLSGDVPRSLEYPAGDEQDPDNSWRFVRGEPGRRIELVGDRKAMERAGTLERRDVSLDGPRGIAVSRDEKTIAVAGYFSGAVAFLDAAGSPTSVVSLAPQGEPSPARRGEQLFHDGTISIQGRASCATCHQDHGRTDGYRWMTSGSEPRCTPSLTGYADPAKAGEPRALEAGVRGGFQLLKADPKPDRIAQVTAYLESLGPEPSPSRAEDGGLSVRAARGKALFEGKAGCAECHRGPALSDGQSHDVGTSAAAPADRDRAAAQGDAVKEIVTPRLLELYRTAPYLHDGRAATLEDVLKAHNGAGRHGRISALGDGEIDDLLEFLKSI